MITLHHLRIGRSVFTAWLLEELGLDYALKIYVRDENRRAPPELKNIHPLGKSPVIEDDGMVISESGAIASYLIERYAPTSPMAPPAGDIRARTEWLQWLHYPEGSAFAPLLLKLLMAGQPDGASNPLMPFAKGEVDLHLPYIRDQIGDKPFLLGDHLQVPDIGITYILQLADRLGELGPYPTLTAYIERNLARPAFLAAMEKTGG